MGWFYFYIIKFGIAAFLPACLFLMLYMPDPVGIKFGMSTCGGWRMVIDGFVFLVLFLSIFFYFCVCLRT